jgi:hypothetical protein
LPSASPIASRSASLPAATIASLGAGPIRGLAVAAALLLIGCAAPTQPLYAWDTFPRVQYDALLREGLRPEQQIQAMEAQAERARGANAALPPGFRAHLGLLYLETGNAGGARAMWEAEKGTFPESRPFMDRLLERLSSAARPVTKSSSTPPARPSIKRDPS